MSAQPIQPAQNSLANVPGGKMAYDHNGQALTLAGDNAPVPQDFIPVNEAELTALVTQVVEAFRSQWNSGLQFTAWMVTSLLRNLRADDGRGLNIPHLVRLDRGQYFAVQDILHEIMTALKDDPTRPYGCVYMDYPQDGGDVREARTYIPATPQLIAMQSAPAISVDPYSMLQNEVDDAPVTAPAAPAQLPAVAGKIVSDGGKIIWD